MVLIAQLFFPFPIPPGTPPPIESGGFYRPWPFPWANVVPFETMGQSLRYGLGFHPVRYMLLNVVGLVPLGLFLGGWWPQARAWRRVFATGVAVALAIEGAQLALFNADGLLVSRRRYR